MRLTLLFTLLVSSSAAAQEPAPTSTPPYESEVRSALGLLAAGDASGAATTLRESIARAPTSAPAHCHLGAALTRMGDRAGALESYRTCARLAARAQIPLYEAMGLHGVARLLMEDATRRAEAKTAVAALRAFAIANPAVLSPEVPEAMAIAIDRIEAADAVGAAVRQRRDARQASGNAVD